MYVQDFGMIEKNTVITECGARFHIFKTDKFKMSRLSINFILPADADRSPVTRLMLATMMRGCSKYPTVTKINKKLDELYGATVTWRPVSVGERHIFKISCEMLSNKYRFEGDTESIVLEVCRVVLDILLNPLLDDNGLLPKSHFESEKKLAIDAIRAKINDQKAYAADQCHKLMFGDSPLGITTEGSVEQIENITLEDVSGNIEYFLEHSMLECYYVGNDEMDDVVELVGEAFAPYKDVDKYKLTNERAFLRESEGSVHERCDVMDVSQSRFNIGYTSGIVMSDEDYHAMCLFNEIFGGSSVGKLFLNVREKQSLCYYCYSSYHSATGVIMVGCGIKAENRDLAFREIENQLEEMRAGNISDDEIRTAKRTVISGLKQMSDSPSATEAFHFRRYLATVEESAEECAAKIESVTLEEIVAVAQKVRLDTVYFLMGENEEDEYDE